MFLKYGMNLTFETSNRLDLKYKHVWGIWTKLNLLQEACCHWPISTSNDVIPKSSNQQIEIRFLQKFFDMASLEHSYSSTERTSEWPLPCIHSINPTSDGVDVSVHSVCLISFP